MIIPCDRRNYGGTRQEIRYIVLHYTAGKGDTAQDNGLYFSRNAVGASAHWFVDDADRVLSVPEDQVAWHCGGCYIHPDCRNSNSIAVELCSRWDGDYYFSPETLANAVGLVRELMKKYHIPMKNILRHYDVTGKKCPAPLVEAGPWNDFLEALMRYETLEQVPLWAQATVGKLMETQVLQGDGQSLDLSHDMVRMLVMLDRAGVFG